MDEDVYFVDTRNADHRVPARIIRAPAAPPAAAPARVIYNPPPAAAPAVAYPAQYATPMPPTWYGHPSMYPSASYYTPPWAGGAPWLGGLGGLGGLLGGMGLGDVIKLAADAFASFKSLPAPPSPSGDVGTDVANTVVYMTALAKDATDRKKLEFGGELAGGLAGGGRWGYGWGTGVR
jgi:hypothetical protein